MNEANNRHPSPIRPTSSVAVFFRSATRHLHLARRQAVELTETGGEAAVSGAEAPGERLFRV
jgi:hypothetical protein